MDAIRIPCSWLIILLVCTSISFCVTPRPGPTLPPAVMAGLSGAGGPVVLSYSGDTTWIQVHTDSTYCPGDPIWGHGGEATGGPGPTETWCFERGPGDSCGTNPPWDTNCFNHFDIRAYPSPSNINFWHVATYMGNNGGATYNGDYCLWCGSDSLWIDGLPVDCGTWADGKCPGYGNQWHCVALLTLPDTFDVANGCTLYFDPRYDTECKYDYLYVDFFDGTEWQTLAAFNASSNNPGDPCGDPSTPNPDYWGNTDAGQPNSADWQERFDPDLPAFYRVITPDTLITTSGPMFRWRFVSDGAWCDADGRVDTDGAAFIDNVWVWGDDERYEEDFEGGSLDTSLWSLPDADGVVDMWHISHDPDPLYEGGDGGDRNDCVLDSSFIYRGRLEQGFPPGEPWRNEWHCRLVSPKVPIQNTGCVMQYDIYCMMMDYLCDMGDEVYRFYDSRYEQWCPWEAVTGHSYSFCGQFFWWEDRNVDVSRDYGPYADSVQFGWELYDVGKPGDWCYGNHYKTEFQVDNVSIGFYDRNATWFHARSIDLLHDTFFDSLCAHNSFFDAYNPDTLSFYSGPPYHTALPKDKQLCLDVTDPDGLLSVELRGTLDEGESWVDIEMTLAEPSEPGQPGYGGEYYGTFCPTDFGLSRWDKGSEVWYCVVATDSLLNMEYWPALADPVNAYHTGTADDYFTFSVLPVFPPYHEGPRILLVDGYMGRDYDYAECIENPYRNRPLEDIYEETLIDAGYCYDKFDILGVGNNVHIHPVWLNDYDCVLWFTGGYYATNLFDGRAQNAIRDYLGTGGKVVMCGNNIARSMGDGGADSLGGEFLSGIMGCEGLGWIGSSFYTPYLYAVGAETLEVFGQPVDIGLDTLVIYTECPSLKSMDYVALVDSSPPGYTAQRLMYLTNASVGDADEVIYTEYQGAGQCAFVNFDLSASANHERAYCSGITPGNLPDFPAGEYEGRVDLLLVILEDIFGLPPSGGAGVKLVDPQPGNLRWMLAQNAPNPVVNSTQIRYGIAHHARVRVTVYDALGRRVRTLLNAAQEPGEHSTQWDGRNDKGEAVTSGVYFYKMEAGDFTSTRKMLVLR